MNNINKKPIPQIGECWEWREKEKKHDYFADTFPVEILEDLENDQYLVKRTADEDEGWSFAVSIDELSKYREYISVVEVLKLAYKYNAGLALPIDNSNEYFEPELELHFKNEEDRGNFYKDYKSNFPGWIKYPGYKAFGNILRTNLYFHPVENGRWKTRLNPDIFDNDLCDNSLINI